MSVEGARWPDTAIGCPSSASSAEATVTPGYLIRLSASGLLYEYHYGGGYLVTCAGPQPAPSAPGIVAATPVPVPPELTATIEQVRGELARELGVPTDQVLLVGVEPRVSKNTALDCPEPGKDYDPIETRGYLFVFNARGDNWAYATDLKGLLARCDKGLGPPRIRGNTPTVTFPKTPAPGSTPAPFYDHAALPACATPLPGETGITSDCRIPDRYMVLFWDGVPNPRQAVEEIGWTCKLKVLMIWEGASGFVFSAPASNISCVVTDTRVRLVEADTAIRLR